MPLKRAAFVLDILSLSLAMPLSAQQLRPIVFTDLGRLCSVDAAGAAKVCLPENREFSDVVWSPNHRTLVTDGGAILSPSGKRIGSLKKFSGIRPVWAPDGQHIFAIDYELGSAVRRWNARGETSRVIPVDDANGGNSDGRQFQMLSFSPSGRHAALLTMHFRGMVIADVQADKFLVTASGPVGFDYVSQSVWLAEDTLVFVAKRHDGSSGVLWRFVPSTGAVDSLGITGLSLRDQIVLSPDLTSVVVTATSKSGRETRWTLWHYDLRSRVATQLTHGMEDIVRSWR